MNQPGRTYVTRCHLRDKISNELCRAIIQAILTKKPLLKERGEVQGAYQ